MAKAQKSTPPIAKRIPTIKTWHGFTKQDDYHWLKAANWQEVMQSPAKLPKDIRDYLEAENLHYKAEMADTKDLQKLLFKEMKGRIKADDSSVPAPQGDWIYQTRFKKGSQYPLYFRTPAKGGKAQLMFDENALAKGPVSYTHLTLPTIYSV